MRNETHCAGCGHSFESYGLDRSEGVEFDGLVYCNDDCQLESDTKELERRELAGLSDEY